MTTSASLREHGLHRQASQAEAKTGVPLQQRKAVFRERRGLEQPDIARQAAVRQVGHRPDTGRTTGAPGPLSSRAALR